jgi:hypothetical protein
MHNVMTPIPPECMFALYSAKNKNLVIVVQQLYEEEKPAFVLWSTPAVAEPMRLREQRRIQRARIVAWTAISGRSPRSQELRPFQTGGRL